MPAHHLIPKIVSIGDTLHRSGCAPYKLEKYVEHYARNRGIETMVLATPTSINYQFFDDDNTVVMKRQKPASIDLNLLGTTIKQILKDDDSVENSQFQYPVLMRILANMCIPAAYLMLVGSTYHSVMISFLFGLVIWFCQSIFTGRRSNAVEFVAALLVGFTATALNGLGFYIPVWGLCIASVLIFVPGLSICNALECLAFNDLVSGTSLLGQAIVTLIKLFIGIVIGIGIGEAFFNATPLPYTNQLAPYFPLIGLPLLSFGIGITFNVRPRDMALGFPIAVFGMWGPGFLGFENGWIVGTWLTSTAIALYGTWLARRLYVAGAIYIVQGIIILVPGTRVLISASQTVFEQSVLPMPGIGLSAAFMFAGIMVGQITAYSIYSPKVER